MDLEDVDLKPGPEFDSGVWPVTEYGAGLSSGSGSGVTAGAAAFPIHSRCIHDHHHLPT